MPNNRKNILYPLYVCLSIGLLLLTACGGGGGTVETTTITGSVFASNVNASRIIVKDSAGNVVAGPVTGAADGSFSIAVPSASLSGGTSFEATGGTYADEASGQITSAGTMTAYAAGGTLHAGSSVNIDPSSTIIQFLVAGHAKSPDDAKGVFNAAFGYMPDTSVSPANAPSAGQDKSRSLAGLRAMAFSQLTKDLGLRPEQQFNLLAALGQDLADGKLDGKNGAVAVQIAAGTNMAEDIQNRFDKALAGMLANSTANKTGLKAGDVGNLAFGKVALSASYKIEYLPGMSAAKQGKAQFKIKVTKRSDGSAVTGLVLSLMPKMHMSDMSHSTPVDVITDNGDGTYSCTLYYLMASGAGMGFWELKVMTGSGMSAESVTFYPSVAMSMGTTTKANLKGVADLIPGMMGATSRTYPVFFDGVTVDMGLSSTLKLYIAASDDSMLMNWPAVSAGTTLHDQSGAAWVVNSMTVEASTDLSTWLPGTDSGSGHWSVPALSGLSSGGTVYVRITINGEQKTTDGRTASGVNGYQTFTISGGM